MADTRPVPQSDVSRTLEHQVADLMTVCLARLLRDGEIVFSGVASNMPFVAILAARRLHAPRLTHVTYAGTVNPSPRAATPSPVDPFAAVERTAAFWPMNEVFELCMRGGIDTVFMSAFQVDAFGRLNMTLARRAERTIRFTGGAGGPVMVPAAGRTIVWLRRHDCRTLVESCDFVTAAGRVTDVITPLAQFQRLEDGRLTLASVHPWSTAEIVRRHTQFDLPATESVRFTDAPSAFELSILNEVDPGRTRDLDVAVR